MTSSSPGACHAGADHSGNRRRPAAVEDHLIREHVKELTSEVLQQGRVDPEAVRKVASAVLGRTPGSTEVTGAKARGSFAEAVMQLDDALVKSASATHGALQQLASRGQDFTDNDLKEALVSLRKLEEDYVAVSNWLAEAMSANLRREMTEIAAHAQNLGVEASVRVASMMGKLPQHGRRFGAGDGARRKRPYGNACQWRNGRHCGCTARPDRGEGGQIATNGLRVAREYVKP